MVVNPAGYVPIFDGGNPKIITARTAVGVTGGQLVYFSGGAAAVSSGLNSFVASDINIIGQASGALFNGVVITPGLTASGTANYVGVAVDGMIISTSAGTILAGGGVEANGDDALIPAGSYGIDVSKKKVGRSITAAGSEQYCVWQITP